MRLLIPSLAAALAAAYCVCVANPSIAQQVGNNITADQKDIGKIQVQIERYDQALGVVSQLSRLQSSNVECNGVCYFPSSSRPISWKCEPGKKCDLRCTVSPPVGGCN
jgi:hypothetical protein